MNEGLLGLERREGEYNVSLHNLRKKVHSCYWGDTVQKLKGTVLYVSLNVAY